MDFIITVINVILTIFSAVSAWNANKSYDKLKKVSIYSNTNIALLEIEKIEDVLIDLMKISNESEKRATNNRIKIKEEGEKIKKSLNTISNKLSSKDNKEIQKLLVYDGLNVEPYIDSFITGSILVDENFNIDDDFQKCQQSFKDIKNLLKDKLEGRQGCLK
ncbi:hypothetical protein [Intestinibacter bartlettii]|uniref:hypothetical protein n=1 Tax=Intestinibacter bartlettii TaxID=261299 RepID=UPI0011063EC0|nr:hypothetical protein [Intestinibacter bartlettii]